jgi:hypothetical protein
MRVLASLSQYSAIFLDQPEQRHHQRRQACEEGRPRSDAKVGVESVAEEGEDGRQG